MKMLTLAVVFLSACGAGVGGRGAGVGGRDYDVCTEPASTPQYPNGLGVPCTRVEAEYKVRAPYLGCAFCKGGRQVVCKHPNPTWDNVDPANPLDLDPAGYFWLATFQCTSDGGVW